MRSGQLNPSHVPRALSSIWRLLSISTPINRTAGTFNGLKSHRGDLRCCYNDLTLQFNIQHFCNSLIWFKLKFLNTAVDSTALEIIYSSSQCTRWNIENRRTRREIAASRNASIAPSFDDRNVLMCPAAFTRSECEWIIRSGSRSCLCCKHGVPRATHVPD